MRIAVGLFLAVVLSILGFGFYWQHRLAPLMNGSGMSLVPSKLELVSVPRVRPIDVGYAKFDIPAESCHAEVNSSPALNEVAHRIDRRQQLRTCGVCHRGE